MSFLPVRPLGAAIGCLVAATVTAQDVETMSEVNVTAKGYESSNLETPISTSSVNRQDWLDRGARNVGDALRGQPGISVASDGAQGQNPVIRGLRRESIVLLVDGMRMNSAQPAGAIASFMSLGLADRIEVVRGPASVLYGTGALGGAINVLLPQARFEPGLHGRAGTAFDSASSGLRGGGVLNLSGGDHALMLGASAAQLGDYRAPGDRVDHTAYDTNSLIGQYRYRIDAAQQLRLSLQQHVDRDVWYPGSARPATPAMLGTAIVHSPEQKRLLAELGYRVEASGERALNFDARLYRQQVQREVNAFATALGRDQTDTRVSFTTDGIDLKADWLAHPAHLLSFGANLWRMDASPERYLNNNPPLFNNHVRNDPFDDGRIEAAGLWLQDDMRFGSLSVLAGLRHDSVRGEAASIGNGARTSGLSRTDSANSGSLGAIWEVLPLLRPYVNLSRAFRAADMRERFEASPRGDGYFYLGNPQIRPEVASQFELGLKGDARGVSYTLSAYRTRISDFITGRVTGTVQNGLPVKQTENIGEAILRGIEAQARWQFRPQQWLSLAWSQVRGWNKDLDEPLFQMPADELTLGWQGVLSGAWTADAAVRLVKRQDRVASVFSRGTENASAGFATADFGLSYRWRQQRVRAALLNAFDKPYHEHLAEGVSGQEIRAPGRSLMVSWQASF